MSREYYSFRPYYFEGLFRLVALMCIPKCVRTWFVSLSALWAIGLVRKMCSNSLLILIWLTLVSAFQIGSLPGFIWVGDKSLSRHSVHSVAPIQGQNLFSPKPACHYIFTRSALSRRGKTMKGKRDSRETCEGEKPWAPEKSSLHP